MNETRWTMLAVATGDEVTAERIDLAATGHYPSAMKKRYFGISVTKWRMIAIALVCALGIAQIVASLLLYLARG